MPAPISRDIENGEEKTEPGALVIDSDFDVVSSGDDDDSVDEIPPRERGPTSVADWSKKLICTPFKMSGTREPFPQSPPRGGESSQTDDNDAPFNHNPGGAIHTRRGPTNGWVRRSVFGTWKMDKGDRRASIDHRRQSVKKRLSLRHNKFDVGSSTDDASERERRAIKKGWARRSVFGTWKEDKLVLSSEEEVGKENSGPTALISDNHYSSTILENEEKSNANESQKAVEEVSGKLIDVVPPPRSDDDAQFPFESPVIRKLIGEDGKVSDDTSERSPTMMGGRKYIGRRPVSLKRNPEKVVLKESRTNEWARMMKPDEDSSRTPSPAPPRHVKKGPVSGWRRRSIIGKWKWADKEEENSAKSNSDSTEEDVKGRASSRPRPKAESKQ